MAAHMISINLGDSQRYSRYQTPLPAISSKLIRNTQAMGGNGTGSIVVPPGVLAPIPGANSFPQTANFELSHYVTKKVVSQGMLDVALLMSNVSQIKLYVNERFDISQFTLKKTITGGLLDVALLMTNVSQLKALIDTGPKHGYFYFLMTMVSISIILQIGVGIIFLLLGRKSIVRVEHQAALNRLNNIATVFVFLITAVNIFTGAFGISASNPDNAAEEASEATTPAL